ncbi:hypothetical protein ThimaDRAFT_1834 [Thiocapsa marina 5811]|uniref:Uncharacterized protein n=1 Tax=Thiocapsa marina 5811 TaxID=768671 RepID=F9UA82_9GAMM|nr:hypothetical protein ThimaDRAFT_1834 [Thiocapsa marina 5811]
MSLADLMKRRVHRCDNAVMTVTPATPATLEGETGATVATVATVAVIERRRLWMVRHPDGWISHSFTPPITESEVRVWHPDAEEVVEEEEPVVVITEDVVVEEGVVEVVVCHTCDAFERNPINPVGGLGRCRVDAPASRRAGSLWPWSDAAIRCGEYQAAAAHNGACAVS